MADISNRMGCPKFSHGGCCFMVDLDFKQIMDEFQGFFWDKKYILKNCL